MGHARDTQRSALQTQVFEAIYGSAVDAILAIDQTGKIELANPATERLFGYTQPELIGQNVRMLMPEPYRSAHDGYLADYLRTGEARIIGIGREVVALCKDGSTVPVHLAVSETQIGGRSYFVGFLRDISDLKQVEQRLAELNEELEQRVAERTAQLDRAQAELVAKERLATLGQVAGGIAHEIRNPLNAVRTSAYFLLNAKSLSPEKTRDHLERIDRQVGVINSVVNALSDVVRLPDARLQRTELAGIVQEVIEDAVLPPGIVVQWQVEQPAPQVLGDHGQLAMLFRNLIRNALDAMGERGRLTATIGRRGTWVRAAIRDTGVGIETQDLPRVFEPLYSTKARGMGLGLAICKTIVEKNRGHIEVSSERGQGTEFTVLLPVAEVPADGTTAE